MPHHKSAKKRLRQSAEHRLHNRGQRSEFKAAVKAAVKDPSRMPEAASAADKAAHRGLIHPNKAARIKSRLMKKVRASVSSTPA
jgi:small subunit ribosomal protein S20